MLLYIITLAVLSQPVQDLDPQHLQEAVDHLPAHVRVEVTLPGMQRPSTVAAFEFEDFKQLLSLSYDHLLLQEAEKLYQSKVSVLEVQVKALEGMKESLESSLQVLGADHDRLYKKWEEENLARRQAEEEAASPWPWVVAGAGAICAGVGAAGGLFDYENGWAWGMSGVGVGMIAIGLIDGFM